MRRWSIVRSLFQMKRRKRFTHRWARSSWCFLSAIRLPALFQWFTNAVNAWFPTKPCRISISFRTSQKNLRSSYAKKLLHVSRHRVPHIQRLYPQNSHLSTVWVLNEMRPTTYNTYLLVALHRRVLCLLFGLKDLAKNGYHCSFLLYFPRIIMTTSLWCMAIPPGRVMKLPKKPHASRQMFNRNSGSSKDLSPFMFSKLSLFMDHRWLSSSDVQSWGVGEVVGSKIVVFSLRKGGWSRHKCFLINPKLEASTGLLYFSDRNFLWSMEDRWAALTFARSRSTPAPHISKPLWSDFAPGKITIFPVLLKKC